MICMLKVIHYYLQMHDEIFRNKYIEIYELNPAHFLSTPELAWQTFKKKTEVNLEFVN